MSDIIKKENSMQSALLEIVQRKDIDPDRLEKFMDLQFKLEERQAERAFNEAMSKFQGECPIIPKTKKVDFTSKSGNRTHYDYAPLDEIVFLIKPILQKNGLSFSFDIKNTELETVMLTTISHIDGFSKTFTYEFDKLHDDSRMNPSQRRKSAITFAKRGALENALGIVTAGEDDDARRAHDIYLTESQVKEIKDTIKSSGADEAKFLKDYMKVESIESITQAEFKKAMRGLILKRKGN